MLTASREWRPCGRSLASLSPHGSLWAALSSPILCVARKQFQQSWGALGLPLRGRRPCLLAHPCAVGGGVVKGGVSAFSDSKAAEGTCEEGLLVTL